MNWQRAERGGRRAEALAALWLQLKGWTILARRARTAVGEVDLVARRGRTLAFVEVKARATQGEAEHALTTSAFAASRRPRKHLLPATPGRTTRFASTPSSSCPGAGRGT